MGLHAFYQLSGVRALIFTILQHHQGFRVSRIHNYNLMHFRWKHGSVVYIAHSFIRKMLPLQNHALCSLANIFLKCS